MNKLAILFAAGSIALTSCNTTKESTGSNDAPVVEGTLTQGKVTYSMEFDSDDPDIKSQMSMMGEMTRSTTFKEGLLREETSSSMFSNLSVFDLNKGKVMMLMDVPMMDMKKGGFTTVDEMKEKMGGNDDVEKPETDVNRNKKKTIAGYECYQVTITDAEGYVTTMWVTDMIKAPRNPQYDRGEESEEEIGFPMYIEIEQEQIYIIMEASEVSDQVPADAFKMKLPEGYEEATPEEIMQMMKRGGGM